MKGDRGPDEPAISCLIPLLSIEALHLSSRTILGSVVCTTAGTQTRKPGFHTVVSGELIILALDTTELESTLQGDRLLTYQVESVDDLTNTGWRATFTGPAWIVPGLPLRRQYRVAAVTHLEAGLGTRLLRLRPQRIAGHRFEFMNGGS